MQVLLCGNITGDVKTDWRKFKEYEDKLRSHGVTVVNPVRTIIQRRKEVGDIPLLPGMAISDEGMKWVADLRYTIDSLLFCDAIFMMPDWDQGLNSMIVVYAAQALNRRVVYFDGDRLRERTMTLISRVDSSTGESKQFEFKPGPKAKPKRMTNKEFNSLRKKYATDDPDVKDSEGGKDVSDDDPDSADGIGDDIDGIEKEVDGIMDKINFGDLREWLEEQLKEDPFRIRRPPC